MAAYPSGRFDTNRIHFQLAMLAYKFNCWLVVFNREPEADSTKLKHTILALARLRFLLIAAKLWNHAGRSSPRQWPPTGGHNADCDAPHRCALHPIDPSIRRRVLRCERSREHRRPEWY